MQELRHPEDTRAAILTELRTPLTIDSIQFPEFLDIGQVLVRVHYSGICGSQLGEIQGAKGEDPFLPHLLGHEGSGTVLEVGGGVEQVERGDKVVLHWRKGLGIDSNTPKYLWNGRQLNAGWVTTFNEHAIVSENRCTSIPPDSDLEIAALFGCAVTTGFGVVENNAKVCAGESVLVYGTGGVGLNIVQASALRSAYPIIGVDLHQNRMDLASQVGASHVIDGKSGDLEAQILEIVGPSGLDVFVDNTGLAEVVEFGFRLTTPSGRVVLVGVAEHGQKLAIPPLPLHFGKTLVGSHGGDGSPHHDIPRLLRLYDLGLVSLRDLVTDRVPLEQVNEAIGDLRKGKIAGRCLVDMENSS